MLQEIDARLAEMAGVTIHDEVDEVDWQIETIVRRFGLSAFEQRALVFALAAELRGQTRDLVAKFGTGLPSVGLLVRACGEGDAWHALRPDGALRRGQLLILGEEQPRFTERSVRVAEPVMMAIHGERQLDETLLAVALSLPSGMGASVARDEISQIASVIGAAGRAAPLIELACDDPGRAIGAVREAFAETGLGAVALPIAALPKQPGELSQLKSVWLRDAMIHQLALILVGENVPAAIEAVTGWGTPVAVISASVPSAAGGMRHEMQSGTDSQLQLWQSASQGRFEPDLLERLAFHFRLPATAIQSVCEAAEDEDSVWQAARTAARPRDLSLVERIEPRVALGDVIVPDHIGDILQALVQAAQGQHRIAASWGSQRGIGVTGMFAGESGTGKTMAAEGIAHALNLDVYRVELSAVVSKYIGETERNLRRVFASTADAGGVLLFDEADALFGKRSEVRDSHDRYANLEVGYLLQQMEAYRGIAILTTNMPDAIDPAFTRRLRFIAKFTLPSVDERRAIWSGAFPASIARETLDFDKLARLSMTGAVIRNVALGASFRAAGEARAVTIDDVLASARMELVKLDRPTTEIDGREWS
jgi:hypothetical protein